MSTCKLKLLVIDSHCPDHSFHESISSLENIETAGFASNTTEAIVIIELMSPDLILMNAQMAEIDGPQLILRAREKKSESIFIIHSTGMNKALVKLYSALGVRYFVNKDEEQGKLRSIFENVNRNSDESGIHSNAG